MMFPISLPKYKKQPIVVLLALLVLFTLWSSYQAIAPRFLKGSYKLADGTEHQFTLPLRLRAESETIEFSLPFDLREKFPRKYHLIYAGKLEALSINGRKWAGDLTALPSNDEMGHVFDLGPFLHEGRNELQLNIRQTSILPLFLHGIDIQPSRMDPILLPHLLAFLAFFALLATAVPSVAFPHPLSLIFLLGVVLRTVYVLVTTYPIRAYDWWGHIEYINLLTRTAELPQAAAGWVTYHPPLFYILTSTILRTAEAFGISFQTSLPSLEILSLLLSIATLGVGITCMTMLFRKREECGVLLLSSALLATFPSLIFPSSNIGNDALLQFLAFLALFFLIRFWNQPRRCDSVALSVVLGLALLTKANAAVLVITSYLVLLFHPRMHLREKLTEITQSILIIAPLAAWFYVQRFLLEGGEIVGNASKLHPMLLLHPTFQTFLTFNPVRMLLHPFVNDWYDIFGREFFFEYLLRSALFGRFHFGESLIPFAQLLLLSALILCIPLLRGLFEDVRRESDTFPLWIPLAVLLSAHILFVLSFPYSSSQDFRYSLLLTVPLAAYEAKGIFLLRGALREGAMAAATLFIALSSTFPFLLFLSS